MSNTLPLAGEEPKTHLKQAKQKLEGPIAPKQSHTLERPNVNKNIFFFNSKKGIQTLKSSAVILFSRMSLN